MLQPRPLLQRPLCSYRLQVLLDSQRVPAAVCGYRRTSPTLFRQAGALSLRSTLQPSRMVRHLFHPLRSIFLLARRRLLLHKHLIQTRTASVFSGDTSGAPNEIPKPTSPWIGRAMHQLSSAYQKEGSRPLRVECQHYRRPYPGLHALRQSVSSTVELTRS